ncbi:hypothetical protein HMPREF9018_0819 [Prevotella amnii CRIS 21A-A]|uniref:Uncharacterized protein n=1 Tax=Prevotella amnii CRIS 21A-A TaxID=679191 RepID=E1GVL5_9BACT|nr:hypothetical protein HMPREF9018_0819 [Prevotella amnii CRIS 21A-A]
MHTKKANLRYFFKKLYVIFMFIKGCSLYVKRLGNRRKNKLFLFYF